MVDRWISKCLVGIAAVGLTTGLATSLPSQEAPSAKGLEFFEKRIRPVLVDHCYECHSGKTEKPKGGLRVDFREGMLQGGESGAAIVPGHPEDSLLIESLRHEGLEMPPDKKLPDEVIQDFVKWVSMGAPDPRKGEMAPAKSWSNPAEAKNFWAFQPVRAQTPPAVKTTAWPRSEIDQFVLARLEAQGLQPVDDADRRTMIRRLSFDLLGLPPTPEEVEAFVKDSSPRALETLVDRYLESPHFGERWGRHWLDVARYAESNGNTDNVTFPHAWRYRDYVIASFNRDKPFDRFILEQVAGDLLPADSPIQKDEQRIATGFLALGSKPRSQNNPDFQMDVVAEQIEVTTTSFMGLTVACARCHDHKFDPIPTEEYYAMAGIFTSTQTLYSGGGGNGNGRQQNTGFHALESGVDENAQKRHASELATERNRLKQLETQLNELGARFETADSSADSSADSDDATDKKGKNAAKNAAAKNAAKNKAKNKAKKAAKAVAGNKTAPDARQLVMPQDASDDTVQRIRRIERLWHEAADRIATLEANPPPANGLAMGVRDAARPADCKLCLRGDSQKRGPEVPRGFVSVVTPQTAPSVPADQSGRLELAQWIASSQNPLTARVFVNRVWKQLFGRGLVPTVDNFGALGEKPSHPELLDYLAQRFVTEGWSVKRFIRTLVLTRSYALSSRHDATQFERDPDNVYLWRHSPRRLDGEAIRDAILVVSGTLDRDPPHGSPVAQQGEKVIQPAQRNGGAAASDDLRCRSVYLPIMRNAMPEMLELFDAADPSLVVGARDVTTVPAQSLYLMNSPFVTKQARRFAERLLEAPSSTIGDRAQRAFHLALGRPATDAERERIEKFVEQAQASLGNARTAESQVRAWSTVTQALLASAEFRYVD